MITYLKEHPALRNFLLFLIVVLSAFAMRTHNYNREAESVAYLQGGTPAVKQSFMGKFLPVTHLHFMPYTIECAMMYGYIQDIAAGKGVASSDKNLHGLEDIAPYAQMIMGLEWFLGWGYRIKSMIFPDPSPGKEQQRFQDNVYLAQWTAFQLRLWISLGSGFLFLLLLTLKCRTSLAFFGGMFHAVAISAIARSTGQDIIRGNFALPVICGFLLLLYSCYTRPARWKYILLALTAFLAFSTWDLCLGFFSALVMYEIGRWLLGGIVSESRRKSWILVGSAVVLSSLLIPFNRAYQTIMSPLVLILLPLLAVIFWKWKSLWHWKKRFLVILFVGAGLWCVWNFCVKTPYYVSHYSHFSELTAAKLKFNNVKPKDPEKLSYDARMMWTPAMHSADWKIIATYFPSPGILCPGRSMFKSLNQILSYTPFSLTLFYLLLLAVPFFPTAAGFVKRNLPRSLFPLVFTFVFTIGFIYIVRYHEFLILFFVLALSLLLDDIFQSIRYSLKKKPEKRERCLLKTIRFLLLFALVFLLILELTVSLFGKRNYDGEVRFRETASLLEWFRTERIDGKGVLTDFGLGPMLKCYAGTAIALQPQFGLERIRRPVEIWLNLLYHGTEQQLAEFCNDLNMDFVVFNYGYTGPLHIYSDRYIAGAKKIRGTSPANLMRYRPDMLSWFYRITPPVQFRNVSGVYSVFRVIRPQARVQAVRLCFRAQDAYRRGKISQARRMIANAFMLDPVSEQIRIAYFRIFGEMPVLGLNGIRRSR